MKSTRAHPRAYGENLLLLLVFAAELGSSPRIRGKLMLHWEHIIDRGLIPAHTGKTCRRPCTVRRYWAHPRAYGENPCPLSVPSSTRGSSPRIRGKLGWWWGVGVEGGLIPAHTGKTLEEWQNEPIRGAHPRAYGENAFSSTASDLRAGSSPRIRGKRRE